MPVHDSFEWTNAVLGGISLLITTIAACQATKAKTAARNAKDSILRHNAEIDFSSLTRLARELHGFIEKQDLAAAMLRANDLRTELQTAVSTHQPFLASELALLEVKQLELKLVAEGLYEESGVINPLERIRLLKITGEILDVLARQSGKLRNAEAEGVPHA